MGTQLKEPTVLGELTAIGVRLDGRPIWQTLGGADDDTDTGAVEDGADDTTSDAVEDDAQDAAEEGAAAKPKPDGDMVSRTELRKATAARDAAKREARDARAEAARLKQAGEDETARAVREAGEAALAEAEKKYKPLLVKNAARAELAASGVKDGKVDRLIKLLELGEIEVDGDGEVSGLSEQVEALREEWPEFFVQETAVKPEPRKGSRAADGADRKPAAVKPLTATERQAAALLGKAV